MTIEEKEFINFIKNTYTKPITLVDVGANLGNYTEYFNSIVTTKKNYLFEPIKSCLDKIKKEKKYELCNVALGAKKGNIVFYEAKGKESHSSAVNREWLYSKPEYNIDTKIIEMDTLDNLINEVVHVLKIDTEGYELEVLKGSKKLLESGKIHYIQFEYGGTFIDNNLKLNDVISFLSKFDYDLYEIVDGEFKIITEYVDDYKWVNFFSFKKIQ